MTKISIPTLQGTPIAYCYVLQLQPRRGQSLSGPLAVAGFGSGVDGRGCRGLGGRIAHLYGLTGEEFGHILIYLSAGSGGCEGRGAEGKIGHLRFMMDKESIGFKAGISNLRVLTRVAEFV